MHRPLPSHSVQTIILLPGSWVGSSAAKTVVLRAAASTTSTASSASQRGRFFLIGILSLLSFVPLS